VDSNGCKLLLHCAIFGFVILPDAKLPHDGLGIGFNALSHIPKFIEQCKPN